MFIERKERAKVLMIRILKSCEERVKMLRTSRAFHQSD